MDSKKCILTDRLKRIQGATLKIHNKRFPVYKGLNPIGRNKAAVINVKNLNVSHNHASIIIVDDKQHFISDSDSSNGTYLHGSQLVPFKLYELTDQAEIKLGDVLATYIKMSDVNSTLHLPEENLEMTQNVTQNFYAANTQIISEDSINISRLSIIPQLNRDTDDIHEAATQVVELPKHLYRDSLDIHEAATQVVELPKHLYRDSLDIHEAPTQVVDYPLRMNNKNLNALHQMDIDRMSNFNSEVLVDATKDIHEAPTQVVLFPKASTSKVEEDLHDAATQIVNFLPNNVPHEEEEKSDNKKEQERMELKINSSENIHEIATQVTNVKPESTLTISSSNDETEIYKPLPDSLKNTSAMDHSVIEETIIDETINENENTTVLNGNSNDSVDFLDIQKDSLSHEGDDDKSSSTPSTQEIGVSKLRQTRKLSSSEDLTPTNEPNSKNYNSDSDTDVDEDIIEKYNQTQKITHNNDSPQFLSQTDEIIKPKVLSKKRFLDSDSETDAEENKENIENKMPSAEIAQDEDSNKTEILDDTDLIPPTQDAFENLFNYKGTSKQTDSNFDGLNGSSEESFKLGLTEMMIDTEESKILEKSHEEQNNKNFPDDLLLSAGKIDEVSKGICDENESTKAVSQITDEETEDIYLMPTQNITKNKLPTPKVLSVDINQLSNNPSTSKVVQNETEDFYLMPTQQINEERDATAAKNENEIKNVSSTSKKIEMLEDDSLYLMATQKINEQPEFKEPPKKFTFRKKETNLEGSLTNIFSKPEDVYNIPTQKINEHNEYDEIYFQATQKINEKQIVDKADVIDEDNDIYLQATQKLNEMKVADNTDVNEQDSDIFLQPTQDLHFKENETKNDSSTRSNQRAKKNLPYNDDFKKPESPSSRSVRKNKGTECNVKLLSKEMDNRYFEPTQDLKIGLTQKGDQFLEVTKEEDLSTLKEDDDRFLLPTQKIDTDLNCYDLPTQPISGFSEEGETQKEIYFPNQEDSTDAAMKRPSNPLAQVLTDDIQEDSSSKVKTLKYTNPVTRKSKRIRQSDIEQFKKAIDTKDVESETLSQIEAFVKQPLEIASSKEPSEADPSSSKQVIKNSVRDKEEGKKSGESSSNITDTKDIERKKSHPNKDLKKHETEQEASTSKSKRLLKKKDSALNIQEDKEKENQAETLSQIEAFIKKPLDVPAPKSKKLPVIEERPLSRRSKRKLNEEEQQIHQKPITESEKSKDATELSHTKQINNNEENKQVKGKAVLKPKSTYQVKGQKLNEEFNDSVASTSHADQDFTKSDIDQSFALLEAKSTKTRKSQRVTDVGEIKVASKNRRSMTTSSVRAPKTENLLGASRTSRRIKENNITEKISIVTDSLKRKTVRNKNKEGTSDSDFESEIPAKVQKIQTKKVGENKKIIEDKVPVATNESIIQKIPSTPVRSRAISRRTLSKMNETSGQGSESSSLSEPSTPTPSRKRKMVPSESILNSAEKAKRKTKPKVVFTMLDNPELESYIKHLGGSIVDTVDACTVLVTEQVKRSQKLLSAVGQGKPVCSPQWILESKKSNEFLDPWDYILKDPEAEAKWDFTLKESLMRASREKLLTNYTFLIMVQNAADVLKGAIESSGGKCVTRNPQKNTEGFFVIIASPENRSKYLKIKKQNPEITVVEPEAVFDGVLRQDLRLGRHILT